MYNFLVPSAAFGQKFKKKKSFKNAKITTFWPVSNGSKISHRGYRNAFIVSKSIHFI